jgi:hypothetical protein
MNESRLVILQVMSARNEDNSLFEGGGSGSLMQRSTGRRMRAEAAYGHLLESRDPAFVNSIVRETRDTWLASYRQLLSLIRVPTVLLWFSIREPDYAEQYTDVRALFGEFPHLVNNEMVESVSSGCDAYAHCVTDRGRPQQLRSRFSGRPTRVMGVRGGDLLTENRYYPSPEMHQDAAAVLKPICQGFLDLPPQRDPG